MSVATEDQIARQKDMGLDLGCHVCHVKMKIDINALPTTKNVNPFCVECEKLYCQEHQSRIDIHFCVLCLSENQQ